MAGKPAKGGRNGSGARKTVLAAGGSRQQTPDEGGDVAVGDLAGRPLLVRAGKQVKLKQVKQAEGEAELRSTETKSREARRLAQYLVRVEYPTPADLTTFLHEISAGTRLILFTACDNVY